MRKSPRGFWGASLWDESLVNDHLDHRIRVILENEDIDTLWDLIHTPPAVILAMEGIGKKRFGEIMRFLGEVARKLDNSHVCILTDRYKHE